MKPEDVKPGMRVQMPNGKLAGYVEAVQYHRNGSHVLVEWDDRPGDWMLPRVLRPEPPQPPDGYEIDGDTPATIGRAEEVAYLSAQGDVCVSGPGEDVTTPVWRLRRTEPPDPLADLRWLPLTGQIMADHTRLTHNHQIDTAYSRGRQDERERVLERLEQCTCSGDAPCVRLSDVIQAIRELREETPNG